MPPPYLRMRLLAWWERSCSVVAKYSEPMAPCHLRVTRGPMPRLPIDPDLVKTEVLKLMEHQPQCQLALVRSERTRRPVA